MSRSLYLTGFALLLLSVLWFFPTACTNNQPAAPAPVTLVELITFTPTPTGSATPTFTYTPTLTSTWTPVTLLYTTTLTPTITYTPTITFTPTITPTPFPTNSLSAFITIGGTSFATTAGIKYYNGNLWVVDSSNYNLQEWTTAGVQVRPPITGYGTPVTNFNSPKGVGIDITSGNVYVADGKNGQVAVFGPTGVFLNAFGNGRFGYFGPVGVGVNSTATTVFALDGSTFNVVTFTIGGTPSSPTYSNPQTLINSSPANGNLAIGPNDHIYLATYSGGYVAEYTASGGFVQNYTNADIRMAITDMTVTTPGNVYVTDDYKGFVEEFNSSGAVIGQFGVGIPGFPEGITTDGAGNFYVSYNNTGPIIGFH